MLFLNVKHHKIYYGHFKWTQTIYISSLISFDLWEMKDGIRICDDSLYICLEINNLIKHKCVPILFAIQ